MRLKRKRQAFEAGKAEARFRPCEPCGQNEDLEATLRLSNHKVKAKQRKLLSSTLWSKTKQLIGKKTKRQLKKKAAQNESFRLVTNSYTTRTFFL
jgi:hypothetical protein